MHCDGSVQRVNNYLKFLGDSLLLRLVPPLGIRLKRRRGSPKLCPVDHVLRAGWLQEYIPLVPAELARHPHLTSLAGHLAESIFGAVVSTIRGLDVAHHPKRGMNQEVDFVLIRGEKHILVEVKYQKLIDPLRDTLGVRSFLEKAVNSAPFGLLITQDDSAALIDPPRHPHAFVDVYDVALIVPIDIAESCGKRCMYSRKALTVRRS